LSYPLFNANVRVVLLCLLAYSAQAQETQPNDAEETSGAAPVAKPLPSALDNYRIKKETLLAADAKDNNQVGTSDAAKAAAKALGADKGKNELPIEVELKPVEVRAKRFYEVGPLPGLGLTKEEIPGNVQSISAKEIKDAHAISLTDLMNRKLQSVNVNDYQSNPFQMDVTYRGFTASPQLGTAQGISVFLDGIRVNEPFGDVVNWDMIPMNALTSLDVFPGSNPLFGLGTLGGALAMRTKSGFDGNSLDAEVLTGSFGRKQLQISSGWNNGTVALFGSGNFFLEDGWRKNSPSKVNQVFGKGEWQGENARLGLSMLYAGNKLTGNGLLPQEMVNQDPTQVYTSPDQSKNDLLQFQLSGTWDVSDTFNITGQIYNRKSKRKSHTSDVNENFGGASKGPALATIKDKNTQLLQGLPDVNNDGLPDYNNYAYNVAADANGFALDVNGNAALIDDGTGSFVSNPAFDVNNLAYGSNFNTQAVAAQAQVTAADGSGTQVWNWTYDPRRESDVFGQASTVPGALNAPVTSEYEQLVRYQFDNRGAIMISNNQNGTVSTTIHPGTGSPTYTYAGVNRNFGPNLTGNYTDANGFYHDYWELGSINNVNQAMYGATGVEGFPHFSPVTLDANGRPITRDGKYGAGGGTETGYIEGTPTAIFTDTEIGQLGKGASLQLNWNLEQHKFMLGTSLDKANSDYVSKQYLGLLDDNRNAYVAPDLLGWEYYANSPERAIPLNDFTGSSLTKSLYFSETWSPSKTVNVTLAARYNHTKVKNTLAVNKLSSYGDVNRILNALNMPALCGDSNNDGVVDPNTECPTGLDDYILLFDPQWALTDDQGNPLASLLAPETEKFKYRSLNPSLGVTWQAQENLNLYTNLSRGARTPSVIELGCAYDPTPASDGRPRSIAEQRVCNLPGAMSGDPYLKQVRSTSLEFGARGRLTENIEWNASVYRTDLSDDIYFVAVNATSSYFQNIGDTRRQGIEMGMKGQWGRASWGLNYALTDATFQSNIDMLSQNNSSAYNVMDTSQYTGIGQFGHIQVKPGDRMPGVPLHNINANFTYEITDNWRVGLNAVVHSSAFVRGNENNKHQAGPATPIISHECFNPATSAFDLTCEIPRADFGSGTTAGYAVFNFQTSYKFSPEWTLGLQINNLFDKGYASAGRLGLNAFSPSIRGVIGSNGFNYNSADWQGTSFVGTGAPRAAWITLSYEFQPQKPVGSQ
jgi:outer membrane receptor protein involved in Fe transport